MRVPQTPQHKFAQTNGIRMHYVEAGRGPLVVLCHGFPESWYSWRHQIDALADSGFRVVAPDQRGYGRTEKPNDVAAYTGLHTAGDIIGLVHALGETSAVVVGHDWGAPVAWNCALLRPDIFRGLALLSVPYAPRSPASPLSAFQALSGEKIFYWQYFQAEGVAERELERDVRKSMLAMLYHGSGDSPSEWLAAFGRDEGFLTHSPLPTALPKWLTQEDLDFFVGEFERTGFRGGLNWYRNLDRSWELTGFLENAKIVQPAIFIAGEKDGVFSFAAPAIEALSESVPKLRRKLIIPGAGHWIQQERPKEVNEALLAFLHAL